MHLVLLYHNLTSFTLEYFHEDGRNPYGKIVKMGQSVVLPDHLCGTYSLYKQETDELATWLVRNSEKARAAQGLPIPIRSSEKIRVDDFVDLAQEISLHPDPGYYVSTSTIELIHSILRSREKCSGWFHLNTHTAIDQAQNASHAHFINILRQILDILKPLQTRKPIPIQSPKKKLYAPSHKVKPKADGKKSTSTKITSNDTSLGANRRIHEAQIPRDNRGPVVLNDAVSEQGRETEHDDTKAISAPEPELDSEITSYEAEPVSETEDLLFRCSCVLADYHKIRDFVREQWEKYRDANITLIEATQLTSLAFGLSQELETELKRSTKEKVDYQSFFVNRLFRNTCHAHGIPLSEKDAIVSQEEHILDPRADKIAELIFLRPWMHVYKVSGGLQEKFAAAEKINSKVRLTAADITFPTSVKRKWVSEYQCPLRTAKLSEEREIISDLCVAAAASCATSLTQSLSLDQFSLFLRMVVQKDAIEVDKLRDSIWFAFAAQIMVDIQQTLRNEGLTRPVLELLRLCRDSQAKCLKHISLLEEQRPEGKWREYILQSLHKHMKMVENIKQTICLESNRYLLARNPMIAGIACFQIFVNMRYNACATLDGLRSVLAAAHVYNASKHEQPLAMVWQEMEQFISIFTPEFIFAGGIPTSRREYSVRWVIASGFSLSRPTNQVTRHKRQFGCPHHFIVSELLNSMSLATGYKAYGRHAQHLEYVLTVIDIEDKQVLRRNLPLDADGLVDFFRLKQQATRGARLESIELLQRLAIVLDRERIGTTFDYMGLADHCWELQSAFSDELAPKLAEMSKKTKQLDMELDTFLFRVLFDLKLVDRVSNLVPSKTLPDKPIMSMHVFVKVLKDKLGKWSKKS